MGLETCAKAPALAHTNATARPIRHIIISLSSVLKPLFCGR
jgi:hypothetical protein